MTVYVHVASDDAAQLIKFVEMKLSTCVRGSCGKVNGKCDVTFSAFQQSLTAASECFKSFLSLSSFKPMLEMYR